MIIKCKNCNDVLVGDNCGTFISCKCGKIYIDQTPYYVRIGGNSEDIETIEPNTQIKLMLKKISKNKCVEISGEKYYHVSNKTGEMLRRLRVKYVCRY